MDDEHSLYPRSAQHLREAASVAARMEEQCEETYASARERHGSPQKIISLIDKGLDGFRNTLHAILADPHLQPWMDGSDRADLYALFQTFGSFETFVERKIGAEGYRKNRWGAYRDIFASTRGDLRMAGVLLRGTIGNLRHRSTYEECPASTSKDLVAPGHVSMTTNRDLGALLTIDEKSFAHPWRALDYRSAKDNDCLFWATVRDGRPIGSLIAECYTHTLYVPRFAVDPAERKQGIGSKMFGKLLEKIRREYPRRRRLLFTVPETAKNGLAFIQHRGCTAIARIPANTENGEDTLLFERRSDEDIDTALRLTTKASARIP